MNEFTVYIIALFALRVYQAHLEEKALPAYLRGAYFARDQHHRRRSLPHVVVISDRSALGAN